MTPLLTQLLAEADALRELLTVWKLLPVVLLAAVGVGAYRLVARLVKRASRAGYDAQRRLAAVRIITAGVALISVVDVVARQVLVRAPLLGTSLVLVFASGALFALALRLQSAVGGLVLVLRGRIREGDRLVVGEVSGIVEHAGLLRIVLRGPDGAEVYLPAHTLDVEAVSISSPQRSQPVRLLLERELPYTREDTEAIRVTALLCPFRQACSHAEVTHPGGDARRVNVELRAWSAPAAREAEAWLRKMLAAG